MPKRRVSRSANSLAPILLIVGGVLLVLGVLVWQALSGRTAQPAAPAPAGNIPFPEIERITVQDARAALDSSQAVFLDVRDPSNYNTAHIQGAINIPLGEVEARASELDPNQWIITYCTWPNEQSSARAASILEGLGYENVQALLGGFEAWQQANYPLE